MSTYTTGLRAVGSRDYIDFNPGYLGFVGQEKPKLEKGPCVYQCPYRFPNMFPRGLYNNSRVP
jgi:hypothetical protein